MSCLFISLSHFIREFNPNEMRIIISNYLAKNPILNGLPADKTILYEKGMSLNQYLNHMRNTQSWGGALEIKIYCDVFKRNVIVHSQPNNKKIEFISKKKNKIWDILKWDGGHYIPIRTILK
jgi:hypothetical protein